MPDMIRDGKGKGNLAQVNDNNRLKTSSTIINTAQDATARGDSYNINTGIITLTNDAETPVIYLKNNESQSLRITSIAVGVGPSTGGSGGIPNITIIRNPTTGTIISSPTNVDMSSNRNYGSSSTLVADMYKGATGDTMTNGTNHILFFQTANGRLFAAVDELLPTGSSIGLKISPQASNTSMAIYAALICHLVDSKD